MNEIINRMYSDTNTTITNCAENMYSGGVVMNDHYAALFNYASSGVGVLTKAPESLEAPKGAKTVLRTRNGKLVADICENSKVCCSKDILPDIIDVSAIESDGLPKVVIVKFADGTIQKAVLSNNDIWHSSLEQGISICITKKLLDMKAGNGSSIYNKIVNRGVKIYSKSQKEKARKAEEEETQKKRDEKAAEKKRKKKQKREAEIRENQIEIQKEAYLRAMRENNNTSRDVAGWE